MRAEVTQENLPFLIPGKIASMVRILSDGGRDKIIDCILNIYESDTYKELERENTKTWHLGPVALCEMFEEDKFRHLFDCKI